MKTLIQDIKKHLNKEVLIKGWVFNFRSSGKIYFLELRDGTGRIQAIVSKNEVDEKIWKEVQKITMESSIEIKGKVSKHPKKEEFELQISDLKIINLAEEYPIAKKEHGVDFLLDHRHLWLRSKRQEAILKIRDEVIWQMRAFFKKEGFILIDTPILTPTSCEEITTLFETDYFEEKAYLTQSGQLYLEAAALALGKVYDFGPTFRAEKSKTRRHLTEFWMLDAEAAFYEHEDNLKLQEDLVSFMVQNVLKEKKQELELLERDVKPLAKIKPPFPRITYEEAIKILNKKGAKIQYGHDFGGDEETIISKEYDKPLFITHYPIEIKAFYMKPDPNNPKVSLSDDLIAPEGYGEIIGGSQRIDDLKLLEQKIKEFKLPRREYEWYLDLRRYGSVPHSGFGIGIERTVAWICGLKHIREAIPFPRLINRLRP